MLRYSVQAGWLVKRLRYACAEAYAGGPRTPDRRAALWLPRSKYPYADPVVSGEAAAGRVLFIEGPGYNDSPCLAVGAALVRGVFQAAPCFHQ